MSVEKNWKDDDWPVLQRPPTKAGRIPYGYRVNPKNDMELIIIESEVRNLEIALDHLSNLTMSLREASDWLFLENKRELTHAGLNFLWRKLRGNQDTPRKKRNEQLRYGIPKARQKEANYRRGRKIASIKRTMAAKEKKLKELEEKKQRREEHIGREIETVLYDFETIPEEKEIIFKPNEGPQTEFLAATELQVLYGGAAGGGKSFALLADPMRYFGNKNFTGLLIRRTNDELRELKWESQKLYPKAIPGAKWKEKDSMWVFPSGARLWLSYLDRDDDVLRYQGQAYTWIAIDELTQYPTPFAWNYLSSRLRTTDPELKPFLSMRATSNPGGPGHAWVKKMFVDPAVPNQPFSATDIETGNVLVDPDTNKPLFKRRFIPASLNDNPYLADDGIYKTTLLSLPEDQRRKLLYGDWTVNEGAAFPEFRPNIHTCKPFDIPHDWRKFRAADYGYSSHSAVLWFAIDPAFGTLYVYKELYVSKQTGRQLAQLVMETEFKERVTYGVLDSSVWHQRGGEGPSIAEEMIAMGCRWRPSDRSKGSRTAGKNRLHELLRVNEDTGLPGLIIFDTCRQLIADLPSIPSDPKGGDDIDDRYSSDHTYDALRYGIMSRPSPASPFGDWGSRDTYQPFDKTFGY
jgi:hypothetical protein